MTQTPVRLSSSANAGIVACEHFDVVGPFGLVGRAMAACVGRDDVVMTRKAFDRRVPERMVPTEAVNEEYGRSAPGLHDIHGQALCCNAPLGCLRGLGNQPLIRAPMSA